MFPEDEKNSKKARRDAVIICVVAVLLLAGLLLFAVGNVVDRITGVGLLEGLRRVFARFSMNDVTVRRMNMETLILICVVVILFFSLLVTILKRYKRCPSDKVMWSTATWAPIRTAPAAAPSVSTAARPSCGP